MQDLIGDRQKSGWLPKAFVTAMIVQWLAKLFVTAESLSLVTAESLSLVTAESTA
jgi:hypothetical protein